jgi:hypothetical protein
VPSVDCIDLYSIHRSVLTLVGHQEKSRSLLSARIFSMVSPSGKWALGFQKCAFEHFPPLLVLLALWKWSEPLLPYLHHISQPHIHQHRSDRLMDRNVHRWRIPLSPNGFHPDLPSRMVPAAPPYSTGSPRTPRSRLRLCSRPERPSASWTSPRRRWRERSFRMPPSFPLSTRSVLWSPFADLRREIDNLLFASQ